MKHTVLLALVACLALANARDLLAKVGAAAKPDSSLTSIVEPKWKEKFPRRLVLVTGVEGSGTTFLSHLLENLPRSAFSPQAYKNGNWDPFAALNHQLWGSGSLEMYNDARDDFVEILDDLFNRHPNEDTIVVHRSWPDWDLGHYPDLGSMSWDLFAKANVTFQVVVSYRDPKETTHSTYRRGFGHVQVHGRSDVVAAARHTEKYLCLLASQLQALDDDSFVIMNYDQFVRHPRRHLTKVLKFLEASPGATEMVIREALDLTRPASDYRKSMNADELAFLDQFYDARRMERQFAWIQARALEGVEDVPDVMDGLPSRPRGEARDGKKDRKAAKPKTGETEAEWDGDVDS